MKRRTFTLLALAATLRGALAGAVNLQYGSGPTMSGFNAQQDFSMVVTPATTINGGTGTGGTYRDMTTNVSNGATVDTVFTVALTGSLSPAYQQAITFTNLSPAVASVTPNAGNAAWVANGVATVQASHPILGTRLASAPVSRATGTASSMTGYRTASLAYGMQNAVDAAISGLTWGASTCDAFTATDGHSSATRNSSLWCASLVDLTGIPIGRAPGGNLSQLTTSFNGCLVTPQDLIYASHASVSVGDVLYFYGTDSAVHSATVSSIQRNVGATDIGIAHLSASLTNCTSFEIFPAGTWAASGTVYLPLTNLNGNTTLANYVAPPLMHYNQNREVLMLDMTGWGTGYAPCRESNRQQWSYSPASPGNNAPYSGDSGSPVFTALPGSTIPILLGTCYTSAGCPNPALNISDINTALSALGSSYTLTQASMAAFTAY